MSKPAPPLAEPPSDSPETQRALLDRCARSPAGTEFLRIGWSPPVVAFGRRDDLNENVELARSIAERAGFTPVSRIVGGRAAAVHSGSLVIDHYGADDEPRLGWRGRFEWHTAAIVTALATCGVDARVGEVAGEYCPGEFSVNARGAVKISGTAQRVTRRAWLVSSVVQVRDPEPLIEVLVAIYDALSLPFDPTTFGCVATEAGSVSDARVLAAIRHALGPLGQDGGA